MNNDDRLRELVSRCRELADRIIDSSDQVHPAHRDSPSHLLADAFGSLDLAASDEHDRGLLIDWPTDG